MEVTKPEETTVKPKEKQMSATQVAHEIMSAGKNCAPLWVIVKKSSPKKPVGRLSANSKPTGYQQLADSFFGELFFTITPLRFSFQNVAVLLAARL